MSTLAEEYVNLPPPKSVHNLLHLYHHFAYVHPKVKEKPPPAVSELVVGRIELYERKVKNIRSS